MNGKITYKELLTQRKELLIEKRNLDLTILKYTKERRSVINDLNRLDTILVSQIDLD